MKFTKKTFTLPKSLLFLSKRVRLFIVSLLFSSLSHLFCLLALKSMDKSVETDLQLYSFHSTSKGLFGECGKRGGYVEAVGVPQEILDQMYKLNSVNLCPNLCGQVMVRNPSFFSFFLFLFLYFFFLFLILSDFVFFSWTSW